MTNQIIDKYYPAGSPLRDIFLRHSQSVADEALRLMHELHLPLNEEEVRAAAMLHDVGIFMTNAPSIHCVGSAPYIQHGPLGADLLRREGAPETWARVAERHTGAGLPGFEPETLLEKLICYADKFYSKSGSMLRKTEAEVEDSMLRFGPENLEKFQQLQHELTHFAKKV